MKKLLFLIFMGLLINLNSHAQVQSDFCYTKFPPQNKILDDSIFFPFKCNQDDFLNYIPQPNDPTKVVNFNIHVIQKSDGTGNFDQNSPNHQQILSDIVNHIETAFSEVKSPVNPAFGVQFISEPKFRIKHTQTYYWQDDQAWQFDPNSTNSTRNYLSKNLGKDIFNTINIFLNGSSFPVLGGWANDTDGLEDYRIVSYGDAFQHTVSNNGNPIRVALDLVHEVGHTLGLYHTHPCKGPMDTFSDTPPDACCCPAPTPGVHSNNMLSYNVGGSGGGIDPNINHRYLSPMQLAYIHYNLSTHPVLHRFFQYSLECSAPTTSPIEIWGNIKWTSNKVMSGDLIVKAGQKLTISDGATVYFPPGTKLIVEVGGDLALDCGTVAGLCPKDGWNGIELWGDPVKAQNVATPLNQARLTMINGGTITNAKKGVTTSRTDSNGNIVWANTGGGIIQAYKGVFRGNDISVEFHKYHNNGQLLELNNLSYFKNCRFIAPVLHQPKNYANKTFVQMEGVQGIWFQNCSFSNSAVNYFPNSTNGILQTTFKKGNGIFALNCRHLQILNCNFDKLSRGIEFFGSGLGEDLYLKRTQFRTVENGFRCVGGGPHVIRANNFTFTNTINNIDPNTWFIVGSAFVNTESFYQLNNRFECIKTHSGIGFPLFIGSAYNNNFKSSIYISYKNLTMRNMIAHQTEGDNGFLDWQCNYQFSDNLGFVLNPNSSLGIPPTGLGCINNANNEFAANRFNISCPVQTQKPHISLNLNSPFLVEYSQDPGLSFPATGSCSSPSINVSNCLSSQLNSNSCSNTFPFIKSSAKSQTQSIGAELTVLKLGFDAGNTISLLETLENENTSASEKFDLLETSSPLSEQVLNFISSKDISLGGGDLKSILINNSPLPNSTLKLVRSQNSLLEAEELEDVIEEQETPNEEIKALREDFLKKETAFLKVANDFIVSTLREDSAGKIVEIIAVLKDISFPQKEQFLFDLYRLSGDYGKADSVGQKIFPQDFDDQSRNLNSLNLSLEIGGRGFQNLTAAEEQLVQSISTDSERDKPYFNGVSFFQGIEPLKSKREILPELEGEEIQIEGFEPDAMPSFSSYESFPASDTLVVYLKNNFTPASIEIEDFEGNELTSMFVAENEPIVEIDISGLTQGWFKLILISNGEITDLGLFSK